MRYLVSPEFSGKLSAIPHEYLQSISAFLRRIDVAKDWDALIRGAKDINAVDRSVYVANLGAVDTYFSLGEDNDGQYVLFLDATLKSTVAPGYLFASNDPRSNAALNPNLNSALNPNFNAQLNPLFNASINPAFNARLNPNFNSQINPIFNAALNPAFNSQINPSLNPSLNPSFNSAINPRANWAFGGPYVYGLNLRQLGFIVRANESVQLYFDMSGKHVGHLVRLDENVSVEFDTQNKWQGYTVRANEKVDLRFSPKGEWLGLIA